MRGKAQVQQTYFILEHKNNNIVEDSYVILIFE